MSERVASEPDPAPDPARLRIAIVGPASPVEHAVAAHISALADRLDDAGHAVASLSLGLLRPDTWWRTGRRLQDADVVILVHVTPAAVPAHLILLTAARGGPTRPTVVALVHDGLRRRTRAADELVLRRLLASVDAVLVHSDDQAALAHRLGATDVSVAALPPQAPADADLVEELRRGIRPPDLSGPWARYVAAIETIAGVRSVSGEPIGRPGLVERAASATAALAATARTVAASSRTAVDLTGRDLPEWVRPSDVLAAAGEAADVLELARSLGLPRLRPGTAGAAWAALGAIAAVLRVRDGERRSSVIVDPSGPRSVFSRWIRAIGYAPVALDIADPGLDSGSLDVIVRLHPHGCTAADVDEVLGRAARLLRRGGLVAVTLPVAVHDPGGPAVPPRIRHRYRPANMKVRPAEGAVLLPADLRAFVARADALGLSLVGDLDRDITPRLAAGEQAPGAYALVRLTLRRTGA